MVIGVGGVAAVTALGVVSTTALSKDSISCLRDCSSVLQQDSDVDRRYGKVGRLKQ